MINIYKGVSHRVLLYVKHYRSYIQARSRREHVRAIQDPRTKSCHGDATRAWSRDIHPGGKSGTARVPYDLSFIIYCTNHDIFIDDILKYQEASMVEAIIYKLVRNRHTLII